MKNRKIYQYRICDCGKVRRREKELCPRCIAQDDVLTLARGTVSVCNCGLRKAEASEVCNACSFESRNEDVLKGLIEKEDNGAIKYRESRDPTLLSKISKIINADEKLFKSRQELTRRVV